ncbi:MAG: LytTR family transcriptional regulator [Kangiellaceae bacterium]|nr:LytTR family transcriptional regulator [Kangiellaceae bacterium]
MEKLKHYQKYHLGYEIGFLVLFFLVNNTILATSVIMENKRGGGELPFQLWEPFVWEYASAVSTLIMFIPLLWFMQRFPIRWHHLAKSLIIYLGASVVFSLGHVAIMVALRKLVYWTQSMAYDFGDLGFELLYEYRKDLWSFVFIIMMVHSYNFILSRLLGEANLIENGEDEQKAEDKDRLLVKKLGKEFIVKVADIEWLESSGNYVNLHIKGRIYPTRSTLSKLVEQISDKGFCRIHRSYAINLDVVDSITPLSSGDGEIKLTNGKVLNLSRRYKDELKQRLH